MTPRYDIAALKIYLAGIRTEDNPALVKQKSRDFFWYSPVLKRQLDHVTADLVVSPKSEAQVLETLAACHALGIPVTPRGTGTGNYGQAMPALGGGCCSISRASIRCSTSSPAAMSRSPARSWPGSTRRRAPIPGRS